jgi:hypothetical protein
MMQRRVNPVKGDVRIRDKIFDELERRRSRQPSSVRKGDELGEDEVVGHPVDSRQVSSAGVMMVWLSQMKQTEQTGGVQQH